MSSPAGMTLFYFWNVATALVLINVLISLFSSAYSDVSHAYWKVPCLRSNLMASLNAAGYR